MIRLGGMPLCLSMQSDQMIPAFHSQWCHSVASKSTGPLISLQFVYSARLSPLRHHCLLTTRFRRWCSHSRGLWYSDNIIVQRGAVGRLRKGLFRRGHSCTMEQFASENFSVATDGGTQMEEEHTDRRDTFTVEDAIKKVGFGPYQGWLLAYAGMSWTAEAMEMMLLSFVGPAVQVEWDLSGRQESLIASVVFGGMMIGAYCWGVLSDTKGRRFGFFATAVLTFVAGLASSLSTNYLSLMLFRGLVGIGLGGGPVISTWFMEFVPSVNRGLWMVIITLFWTLGSIAEASLAWAVMPTLGWRWLLGLSTVPLAVLLLFYSFVPESPRYLAVKGETTMALKILQQMSNTNGRPLPEGSLVQSQLLIGDADTKGSPIAGSVEMGEAGQMTEHTSLTLPEKEGLIDSQRRGDISGMNQLISSFTALLSPPLILSTLLLWAVFFANAFTYYGLVLLTSQISGGVPECQPDVVATVPTVADGDQLYRNVFVSSIGELPGLAVAAAIVDRVGRKHSMAGLFTLCGAFLVPLVYTQPSGITTFLLFGARGCIMGAFTVLYIYAPEVYPTSSRTTGLGIANSVARIGGLLCPLVAVDLVRSCHGGLAVSLFAVVPMLAGVAVLFFPTETSGRPLTDMVEQEDLVQKD